MSNYTKTMTVEITPSGFELRNSNGEIVETSEPANRGKIHRLLSNKGYKPSEKIADQWENEKITDDTSTTTETQIITIENIEIAQILKVTDGVNASSVKLPDDVTLPASQYPAADMWDSWVNADHDYIGKSVEGGEFLAYRIEAENGEKVTLVMFSWSQGGFDGAALIDGHAESLEAAAMMWLGDTSADEHGDDHAINEILS